MKLKPLSPLAGVSRGTIRSIRDVVELYMRWRRDYLAGTTIMTVPPAELFGIGPGRGLESRVAFELEARTHRWLAAHATAELQEANRRSRLRHWDPEAYERALIRDELAEIRVRRR